jgi:ribonuclease D
MVCERELGVSLDKGEQTSDWGRRPLDAEQIRYAALDAEVLLGLFDRLGDPDLGRVQESHDNDA